MGRARIYCFPENGVQPVNIKWLNDGNTVPREAVLTIHNQALTIPHIDIGHQGSYKCIERSKCSTIRNLMKIFVAFPKTCNSKIWQKTVGKIHHISIEQGPCASVL